VYYHNISILTIPIIFIVLIAQTDCFVDYKRLTNTENTSTLLFVRKFSSKQYQRISEIFGNLSVAWFSAGTITPLFSNSKLSDFLAKITISLIFSLIFFIISLYFAKK